MKLESKLSVFQDNNKYRTFIKVVLNHNEKNENEEKIETNSFKTITNYR
jgi:hypothetical protein